MSLKYSLVENPLTAQTNDYNARPQNVKSHDLESIITQLLVSAPLNQQRKTRHKQ